MGPEQALKRQLCPTLEIDMNARLFAAAAAGLFAIAGAAQAQMPTDAQQLVQTMRPIQPAQSSQAARDNASMQAASTDDASYGGAAATRSMSAPGHRQGSCSTAPNCDIFFGQ
jgi:hypothetical protein